MQKVFVCLLLILFSSTSYAADGEIAFIRGAEGDLKFSGLYSVDYKCRVAKPRVDDLLKSLLGLVDFGLGNGALNANVSIFSSNAVTPPVLPVAGATRTPIFSANAASLKFAVMTDTSVEGSPCEGQFFVSGADNYSVEAQLAVNVTNQAAKLLADATALTLSTSTNLYALFKAQPPPELAASVNNASGLLTNLLNAHNLFGATSAINKSANGQLRIGKNVVNIYDGNRNIVSSLELIVKPVNSLVMDGHTKFLAAYYAASSTNGAAITVSGTDVDAIRGQCALATQVYYSAGITDDRDVAFVLYRRLILVDNSTDKIAKCFGPTVGRSALIIMDKLQKLEPRYRITLDNLRDLVPTTSSDQPHNRPSLADEMDTFTDLLANHLQGDGLRAGQLSKLLGFLAPTVTVEDTTVNYRALKLLYPEITADTSKALTREAMLASFKEKGLKRWLCVQRTKANSTPTVPLYDPDIDAAVTVIVAKAEANDVLDKNKSTLFGVHLKFNKASNSEPLIINRFIFEQKRRDIILKANPTCIPDVTAKPNA
jgi:hypothetical protein